MTNVSPLAEETVAVVKLVGVDAILKTEMMGVNATLSVTIAPVSVPSGPFRA